MLVRCCCCFPTTKAGIGQSKIVLGLGVPGVKLQATLEGIDGFRESVFIIFCPSEEIPAFGIVGSPRQHFCEPVVRIHVIAQQHIVERDDFQIAGAGIVEFRAGGELCQGSSGLFFTMPRGWNACPENLYALHPCLEPCFTLDFAKEDVPEQEVSIGGIRMGLEILTNETVRLGHVSFFQKGVSFGERHVGRLRGRCRATRRRLAGGGGWLGQEWWRFGARR